MSSICELCSICEDGILLLMRIKTPPPYLFLSFLNIEYPAGKTSELAIELSRCDSVPIRMSISCNDRKVSSSNFLFVMLQQLIIARDSSESGKGFGDRLEEFITGVSHGLGDGMGRLPESVVVD